jgi:SAM-dependent methyltransferase
MPVFDYVLLSHTAHHLDYPYLSRLIEAATLLLREGGQFIILDMVLPAREDSWGKHFYKTLDRGKHIRTVEQLSSVMAASPLLGVPDVHVYPNTRYTIPIIDQVVLVSAKQSRAPSPLQGASN